MIVFFLEWPWPLIFYAAWKAELAIVELELETLEADRIHCPCDICATVRA